MGQGLAGHRQRPAERRLRGPDLQVPVRHREEDVRDLRPDILATQPAKFIKTEEIGGLETYQFTQEIRNATQQLPEDRLKAILSQLLPGATSGQVNYNNTRTVWVEPATGQYIMVQEQQNKVLTAGDGRTVTILDAEFTYTDDTINKAAETSKSNRSRLALVSVYVPIGLAVLGVILLIVGILLAARRPRVAGGPAQRRDNARHAAATAPAEEDRDDTQVVDAEATRPEKSQSKAD